jgi:putative phosphoribosyl transferase
MKIIMPKRAGILPFENRKQAGQALAKELTAYRGRKDVLVLALPRGGVPIAFELADALQAPLDVLLVRKLGLPSQSELAFGAIAMGGVRVFDQEILDHYRPTPEEIAEVTARETELLERRERAYRAGTPPPVIANRVIILVDDGLATGSTMRAAIATLKFGQPARVIVATPVASVEGPAAISAEADELVCLAQPQPFRSVGSWYRDFGQVSDREVHELLAASAHRRVA